MPSSRRPRRAPARCPRSPRRRRRRRRRASRTRPSRGSPSSRRRRRRRRPRSGRPPRSRAAAPRRARPRTTSPLSMRVRMKFVVPFTMPSTRWTFVATSDSRSTLITGIAAQTRGLEAELDAGLRRGREELRARGARRAACSRVTTGLPARRSSSTYAAGRLEPAHHLGDERDRVVARIAAKSVVRTPSAVGKSRSRPGSRTSARTTRSRWPVARSMSSPPSDSSG